MLHVHEYVLNSSSEVIRQEINTNVRYKNILNVSLDKPVYFF